MNSSQSSTLLIVCDILANALWTTLDQLNQSLARTLLRITHLHAEDPETYTKAIKYISSLQAVQVSSGHQKYSRLR